jgi:glycine betaine/proline transport system substrate-binding protein
LAALLTLGTAAFAQEQPGEGVTVQPGVATWQSALPLEAVFAQLLGELGYSVNEPQSLSNPIFYQAVTQGDVDYWANGWFPLHDEQLPDNFDDNASRVGVILQNGALQGYLVDAASQEEYDINSLADFTRPEVKEAFDADGDGRADLVGCPPGWGCNNVISHHIEAYELEEHVNVSTAAYAASFADALARYRNGEPVLYYTWTPNFTVFQLAPGEDVLWINVPEIIPTEAQAPFEEFMTVSDVPGAVSDPLAMGFVANDIVPVANNDFLAENPAAEALFEQVQMSLLEISEMTAQINDGADEAEVAAQWIEDNRETVDGWLEEARSAAMQ